MFAKYIVKGLIFLSKNIPNTMFYFLDFIKEHFHFKLALF